MMMEISAFTKVQVPTATKEGYGVAGVKPMDLVRVYEAQKYQGKESGGLP